MFTVKKYINNNKYYFQKNQSLHKLVTLVIR